MGLQQRKEWIKKGMPQICVAIASLMRIDARSSKCIESERWKRRRKEGVGNAACIRPDGQKEGLVEGRLAA